MAGVLAGMQDAIRAFNSQPDLAKQVLQQTTKEPDQSILQQTYDFYRTQTPFQEDLRPTLEGLQSQLDFLSLTVPEAAKVKAPQFVDSRILDTLPA
jgi:hypothetical protein